MIFQETTLPGTFQILPEPQEDQRGFFLRTFCREEFAAHGLEPVVAQCSLCFTHKMGTVRGMHYQIAPALEAKLVRCVAGIVYDVIIDLRLTSPTYLSHFHTILSASDRVALYVPEMCAHGYQTMSNGAEVLYQMNQSYAPECARGVRFDDPAFGIEWPLEVSDISEKDRNWPLVAGRKYESRKDELILVH